jgi:uncharacterized membrane protein YedE/YeeE
MLGILGGLFGGFVFTWVYPQLSPLLGINYVNLSAYHQIGDQKIYLAVALLISLALIALAFYLDKRNPLNKRWILAGVSLAILNVALSLKFVANRPIGASTAYPFLADSLTMCKSNIYFDKIKAPGSWELYFLLGAFLSGLVISLATKKFRFQLIFSQWASYKGTTPLKRVIWALGGGFILIFGARMAGGCTSGHIISGGMQLAFSSLLFGVFTFISFLIIGKIIYKK